MNATMRAGARVTAAAGKVGAAVRGRGRRLGALVLLWAVWVVGSGHVGSPDVFAAGKAGPYDVRVTVRPPSVIPGTAEVVVRVAQPDVKQVVAVPVFYRTGSKGAPKADTLARVAGPEAVFTGPLWIMLRGANTVLVTVSGPAGEGTLSVPLTALSTAQLAMPQGMGAALAVLGVLLVLGLASIMRAAVAESSLAPGASLDPARRRRGRTAAVATIPVLAFVLFGGAKWWSAEEAAYRTRMYRPLAVTGVVWQANGARTYSLTVNDSLWFNPRVGGPVMPDHGKMMHLFLVGDGGAFAHLHPAMHDSATFVTDLPSLPPGHYRVFADVVHESGFERTLTTTLDLGDAPRRLTASLDPDDGWSARVEPAVDGRASLAGGAALLRVGAGAPAVAGEEAGLRFTVREADGSTGRVEPYLGMAAHAVVMREDGGVYVHLHPSGTASMAAQAAFAARDRGDTTSTGRLRLAAEDPHEGHTMPGAAATLDGSMIEFPYAFPSAGRYAVWVQLRRRGQVETARFDVEVAPAAAR